MSECRARWVGIRVARAGRLVHFRGVSTLRPLRSLRATLWLYLSLVALSLFWLLLSQWGVLRPLEDLSVDARYRVRGAMESPVRVVYVDIDSPAMGYFGNFPWTQRIFARVCAALLREGGAKAIGIDVVFSEAGVPNIADMRAVQEGKVEFARLLVTNPPIVLAASYAGRGRYQLEDGTKIDETMPMVEQERRGPAPELPDYAFGPVKLMPTAGLIDAMDGDTREVPIFVPLEDGELFHLSVELARLHWGLPREQIRVESDRVELRDEEGVVVRSVPLRKQQIADVNWFSRWSDNEHNPRVSIARVFVEAERLRSADEAEVAEARAFFDDGYFKDAIILIGPVDPLLQDLAPTPFDRAPVPKVGVHGNMVKTIVSGRFIKRPPEWALPVITIGLTAVLVGLSLASEGRHIGLRRAVAAAIFVAYVAGCFVAFAVGDWMLPMVEPLAAAFSSSFIGGAAQLVLAQKQKGRIKGLFGAYLAPAVVESMVDSGQEPKLGGVEEEITAYFSDVQSFSTFSERLTPTQLVELMNEYLTACTDIVQAEGGTLDKYVGDAVVAMFGAPLALPGHPYRACVAALRVQKRCAELREKWRREPEKNWPDIVCRLRTRIGLNTGRAVVGNMGSSSRFSYTMMGDTVNLAARMESGAASWGVFTMCADPARVACEAADPGRTVVFRRLGRVVVKGREQPVPIHEIVGLRAELGARDLDCVARFEAGLEKYFARDWDGALADFVASAALEPLQPNKEEGVATNPSLVYQALVHELRAHPPGADWNGAYVMKGK
jgi:adenylate cyclase